MSGNIFSDYYLGKNLTDAKSRFDIIKSTGNHPFLEIILKNKKKFNIDGLSFNYTQRPDVFKGDERRKAEMIICKGSSSISSVFVPNLDKFYIGYGDVKTTNDAIIILFDDNKKIIELFIARGLKQDKQQLYSEVVSGFYDDELEAIRQTSRDVFKGQF